MKHKYCVAVADARRARIFSLWQPEYAELGQRRRLVEVVDLIQPSRRDRASERFSDTRPGLHRGTGRGAPAHGVDDHRDAHREEDDRRFAEEVVHEIVRVTNELHADHVVLAATHNMLGMLRSHASELTSTGAEVAEVAQELTQLTPALLYDHLAKEKFLP